MHHHLHVLPLQKRCSTEDGESQVSLLLAMRTGRFLCTSRGKAMLNPQLARALLEKVPAKPDSGSAVQFGAAEGAAQTAMQPAANGQ